ncbi:hypothetical protein ACFV5G_03210 [Streptomyces sp. NPDC059766]|uniref:hypothetical protein n=1 Tax=Streptomyces sp. NPDC059766 TaxID=3346940 RepID=UPI003661A3D6
MAHAALGGVLGLVWLVLPWMTTQHDPPVAITGPRPTCTPVAAQAAQASAVDLVLPLAAVGAAGVVAGYGYVRRTRRARTRTTPGGPSTAPAVEPLAELDRRTQALLVEADDCVRTSREELACAAALSGTGPAAPYARAVREAEAELAAAFAMRQRYDEGVPAEETARRHTLAGIDGRCAEAGRRLDAEAAGFDRLRGPEFGAGAALEAAEARFRQLAGRTGAAQATLAELTARYGPAASAGVTGYVEQAKDRLVFATSRLNRARQTADRGEPGRAALHLRAAEGGVAQAAVFVDEVHRLATALTTAARWLPAALTGAEAQLARVRAAGPAARPAVPSGELRSRLLHADAVLDSVRQEVTAPRPHDPLGLLRRVVRATAPLDTGRGGVLAAAASLVARSDVAGASGFVATHRGVVGAEARTRLAAAERCLAWMDGRADGRAPQDGAAGAPEEDPAAVPADIPADVPIGVPADVSVSVPADVLTDVLACGDLATQARELAELDVRTHGNPHDGPTAHESGLAGAVLGGLLSPGAAQDGTPPSFGGPRTRERRGPAPT